MGEIADSIIDGEVCQVCGEWMENVLNGEEAPGFPQTCAACSGEDNDHPEYPTRDEKKAYAAKNEADAYERFKQYYPNREPVIQTIGVWRFSRKDGFLAHYYPKKKKWRDIRRNRNHYGNFSDFYSWFNGKKRGTELDK